MDMDEDEHNNNIFIQYIDNLLKYHFQYIPNPPTQPTTTPTCFFIIFTILKMNKHFRR